MGRVEAAPGAQAGVFSAPSQSGWWIEAGGTWWSFLVALALLFARQDVPVLEVVGGGGHVELEVDFGQADGLGVACAVVQGEASDVTFDVGAEGEIGLGSRRAEIGEFRFVEQGVVGDEDRAVAVGLRFGVAALLPEGTALALTGGEAVVEAIGAAGAIGARRGDVVGTGETVRTEGEVAPTGAGLATGPRWACPATAASVRDPVPPSS